MKAAQTNLPECFEWYREQIAGHHPSVFKNGQYEIGFIKEKGKKHLLKPVQDGVRGKREIALYTELGNLHNPLKDERELLLAQFATFLPKYFGLQRIRAGDKTIDCLIMEDLTQNYKQPCVMDIKMGKVTYDPDAPPEKVASESVKYPEQLTLGFRLLGYRMHRNDDGTLPVIRDKQWGRTRTVDNIVEAFGEFLSGRPGEEAELANAVLEQLYRIKEWFYKQQVYHFYASSILLVYEACQQQEAKVLVKLIDFSHVFLANGNLDENYIFGLNNVVRIIEEFRDQFRPKN